tara:strand:+ start:41 stop:214 length:174 start_codon:yes stop_codon:yes gene_type:complete
MLDIKPLENWLWEAACKIIGFCDFFIMFGGVIIMYRMNAMIIDDMMNTSKTILHNVL